MIEKGQMLKTFFNGKGSRFKKKTSLMGEIKGSSRNKVQ